VEKFLFGFFFAADELDVIDDQNIGKAVFFFDVVDSLIPERPDDIVGEFLR
jgi:hypothetical protein